MKDVPILRVAAIHDLSGFGRASLTVAIPILATMGIQVCPLPTAVLSSQTGGGMTGFTFLDLTDQMGPMMDHWASLGLKFDAVYSGFLGSPDQSELAIRCIREFRAPGGIAVVDPVLGDNGQLDPTQTPEMVEAMRRLVREADIITPNFTEASFLLDQPYRPDISEEGLRDILR
ncbi:MAG: bifunctional hydroxymethylpyrimidine kinase/phosphomethylpyrimidine kinase, partial [Mailhella sp.]|nr:bifunctional hydroxymethylpyrimidine kinase/phosphomethylpyrimidine kinase [Mailhella sp.]